MQLQQNEISFIKTNEIVQIDKKLLTLELFYILTNTISSDQQKILLNYENKKYNFTVKNAIYEKSSKLYGKNKYKLLSNQYIILKKYINNQQIKSMKIILTLQIPFLLESAIENKMLLPNHAFKLISLAITFNKEITNLDEFVSFANKSHDQKVYRYNTYLCTMCIYNSHINMVSATGIQSINDAELLRIIFDYFD